VVPAEGGALFLCRRARLQIGKSSQKKGTLAPSLKLGHVRSHERRERARDRQEGRSPVARQRVRSAFEGLLQLAHVAPERKMRRRGHQTERVCLLGGLSTVRRAVSALLAC